MNQDKLSKRVEFLRQEKNKSAQKVSTLDEIQNVWIDGDIDASSSYPNEQGLKFFFLKLHQKKILFCLII